MQIYTNGFFVARNDNNDEILVNFFQDTPTYNDDGDITGTARETVSQLVMTHEIANNLIASLASVTNPPKEKD